MTPILVLETVTKVYHPGAGNQVVAVDRVDLALAPGTLTVLQGPSGSGKSTLLALAGGLARPSEGRVFFGDRLVSSLPERFLSRVRRETVGVVLQGFHFLRGLSALENVMVPGVPTGRSREEVEATARRLLEGLGLGARLDHPVERLSGGEAQRVSLARALVNGPRIVLADEPTSNLGVEQGRQVLDLFADLKREGRTVLLTSHDPAVAEHPAVDRVLAMRDGRLDGGRP